MMAQIFGAPIVATVTAQQQLQALAAAYRAEIARMRPAARRETQIAARLVWADVGAPPADVRLN